MKPGSPLGVKAGGYHYARALVVEEECLIVKYIVLGISAGMPQRLVCAS